LCRRTRTSGHERHVNHPYFAAVLERRAVAHLQRYGLIIIATHRKASGRESCHQEHKRRLLESHFIVEAEEAAVLSVRIYHHIPTFPHNLAHPQAVLYFRRSPKHHPRIGIPFVTKLATAPTPHPTIHLTMRSRTSIVHMCTTSKAYSPPRFRITSLLFSLEHSILLPQSRGKKRRFENDSLALSIPKKEESHAPEVPGVFLHPTRIDPIRYFLMREERDGWALAYVDLRLISCCNSKSRIHN